MKQTKERRFHLQLNIIEIEKRLDRQYYRERKILKERDEQEKTLKNNHNNSTIKHSRFRETL